MTGPNIREIPLKGKLNVEERKAALESAKPILDLCLRGPLIRFLQENENISISRDECFSLSEGHAAYAGAQLIIDHFIIDSDGDPIERPASYAFFEDKIICVERIFDRELHLMPAHEASAYELITLLSQLESVVR